MSCLSAKIRKMETYTTPIKTVRIYRQRNGMFLVYYKLKTNEQVKREIANVESINWSGDNLSEEKVYKFK